MAMLVQEILRVLILCFYLRNIWSSYFDVFVNLNHWSVLKLLVSCIFLVASFKIRFSKDADKRPLTLLTNLGAILLPAFFEIQSDNNSSLFLASTLVGLGSFISLISLINLWKYFDILPVFKGLTFAGPYKYIRHPIYTGYIIGLSGMLIMNCTLINTVILILIVACLEFRSRAEEQVLSAGNLEYTKYKKRVRFKFLPGIY